jgi:hypothetical protein
VGNLQIKDVPEDLHRELRRRANIEGLSLRDYLLRLLRRDQQRPSAVEWLDRVRGLEPVDLGSPASEQIALDRAERDSEPLPEQRRP